MAEWIRVRRNGCKHKFSGFLPKAATVQNSHSGGWQSAAIIGCRQPKSDIEFQRLSAESRYGERDTHPDFRAAPPYHATATVSFLPYLLA